MNAEMPSLHSSLNLQNPGNLFWTSMQVNKRCFCGESDQTLKVWLWIISKEWTQPDYFTVKKPVDQNFQSAF